MSFLLFCLLGNKKNIDRNIDDNFKRDININKNNISHNIEEQVEAIQTSIIENNYNETRYSKPDTLIDINEFEKCKYWFTEILKHIVYKYEDYGKNKKELVDYTFTFIDLNKTVKYFKKYNNDYNNLDKNNIINFCKDKFNQDFIQDIIKISENIYRFQ